MPINENEIVWDESPEEDILWDDAAPVQAKAEPQTDYLAAGDTHGGEYEDTSDAQTVYGSRLAGKAVASAAQGIGNTMKGLSLGIERGMGDDLVDINPEAVLSSFAPSERAEYGRLVNESPNKDPLQVLKEYNASLRGEKVENLRAGAATKGLQMPEEYKQPVGSKSYQFLEDTVSGMASFAPAMVATAVSPPAGAAMMFEQIRGGSYDDMIAKGVDPDRAFIASSLSALVQAPIESVGTMLELGIAKKMVSQKGANFVLRLLQSASTEGLEEGLQAVPEMAANVYASNPDLTDSEILDEALTRLKSPEFLKEAGYQMGTGAAGGALMAGGAQALSTTAQAIDWRSDKQKQIDETKTIDIVKESKPKPQGLSFEAHTEEEGAAMQAEIERQQTPPELVQVDLTRANSLVDSVRADNQKKIEDEWAAIEAQEQQAQQEKVRSAGLSMTGEVPGQGVDTARQNQELSTRAPEMLPQQGVPRGLEMVPSNTIQLPMAGRLLPPEAPQQRPQQLALPPGESQLALPAGQGFEMMDAPRGLDLVPSKTIQMPGPVQEQAPEPVAQPEPAQVETPIEEQPKGETVVVDGKTYRHTGKTTNPNGKQVGVWEYEYEGKWRKVRNVQQRIKADAALDAQGQVSVSQTPENEPQADLTVTGEAQTTQPLPVDGAKDAPAASTQGAEPVADTGQATAITPQERETLESLKTMLEDNIATVKARGNQPKQAHLDKLAEVNAKLRDQVGPMSGPSKGVASDQVFGHPQATSIMPAKYGNLIPIQIDSVERLDAKIDAAQKAFDEIAQKRAEQEAIALGRMKATPKKKKAAQAYMASQQAVEDQTVEELLRDETMPELNRLRRQLVERDEKSQVKQTPATLPKASGKEGLTVSGAVAKSEPMTSKEGPGNITTNEQPRKPAGGNPFKDSIVQHKAYHGTGDYFDKFEITSDIGFHFGTQSAAKDRMRRSERGTADVEIETIEPSQNDLDAALTDKKDLSKAPKKDRLYFTLLRKLDNPTPNLRKVVDSLPDSEVDETLAEYESKPDSTKFSQRLKKAKTGKRHIVTVNGETVFETKKYSDAKAKASELKKRMAEPMAVYINLRNPIELPDLGVWPVQEIAEEAGFSQDEMRQVRDAEDLQSAYEITRSILKGKGYDGIKYKNIVEDKGSYSYIVFDQDQISTVPNQSSPSQEVGTGRHTQPRESSDRRKDTATRKRVSEMSPEEMQKALLTDDLTGLGNRRAYEESDKKPIQASIDVDSLKWVNDNLGHEVGDELLKMVGKSLKETGIDAYHPSGDEFWAQGTDKEIDAAMDKAAQYLKNNPITATEPSGKQIKFTAGFSYGKGNSLKSADIALGQAKESREKSGQRAARGERPPGILEERTEGNEAEDRGDRSGKVTPLEKIRANQTKTQAFKRWFGKSKVVDENGEPLVVYHGTPKGGFVAFDKAKNSSNYNLMLGDGFYFTPDKKAAEHYTRGTETSEILSVYLSIKNPLDVSGVKEWREVVFKARHSGGRYEQDRRAGLRDSEVLKELGYDGVVYRMGGKVREIVAFEPTQIKSATGNSGKFDPNNPSITDIQKRLKDQTGSSELARDIFNFAQKIVSDGIGSFRQFRSAIRDKFNSVWPKIQGQIRSLWNVLNNERGSVTLRKQNPQTKTEAFKKWFGKSKAVDSDGNPLVVYHGTISELSEFDTSKLGSTTGATSASLGFFFTDKPRVAESYAHYAATDVKVKRLLDEADKAEKKGDWDKYDAKIEEAEKLEASFRELDNRAQGQNIVPVYLSMQNPIEIDAGGEIFTAIEDGLTSQIKNAKRLGHDGLIIRNLDDAIGIADAVADHYVVFKPTQIKSAIGNRGTFSKKNPSILYSIGPKEYQPVTEQDIKKAFGAGKVQAVKIDYTDVSVDGYVVDMPNGTRLFLDLNHDVLSADWDKVSRDWGIPKDKLEKIIADGKGTVSGKYASPKDVGVPLIQLLKTSGPDTLSHEKFHFLFDTVFDDGQKKAILDRYKTEEKAAEAFRRKEGFTRSFWEKIQAFLDRLRSVFFGDVLKSQFDVETALSSQTGSSQLATDIFNYAQDLRAKGEVSYRQFRTALKKRFAEVWDKIKGYARKIWESAKQPLSNQRGSVSVTIPALERRTEDSPALPPDAVGQDLAQSAGDQHPDYPGISSHIFDEFVFQAQDKMHYLNKAQKRVGDLPDEQNASMAEIRYHGMAAAVIDEFEREQVTPLLQTISNSGLSIQEVDRYLWARHAEEANAQLKKINPDKENNESLSGMKDEQAREILRDAAKSDKYIFYKEIAERVDAITKAQRDLLRESGLESKETIDAWEKAYKHYVPLMREGKGGKLPRRGRGYDTRGSQKRRAGSDLGVVNVLTHVIAQYEATAVRAEKAKVGRAFLEFAKANKGPWTVDKVDYAASFNSEGLVVYRPDHSYRMKDNVLVVRVGGKEHHIIFDENNLEAMRIATGLNNLGAQDMGFFIRSLSKLTRWLSLINTGLNPEFIISNFLRDIQTAGYNMSDSEADQIKWKAIGEVGKAWSGIRDAQKGHRSDWADWFKRFEKAGAKTGWLEAHGDIQKREKKLESIIRSMDPGIAGSVRRGTRAMWDFIESHNTAVENAIRLSTFKNLIESGVPESKAAVIAKELTVNFNRKGNMGPTLNALYMFYNASIQGSTRIIVAAAKSPKVRKLMFGTFAFAAILDMVNRAIGGEDDDGKDRYDKIPEWIKERNLIVMLPDGKGYVSIPLPWGYNVFHVIGQATGEVITKKNNNHVQSGLRVGSAILNAFNPIGQGSLVQTLSPTISDPVIQWLENKDWAGNKLKPDNNVFEEKPESELYWKSVRAPSKWAMEKLNELTGGNEIRPGKVSISPEAMDLIIDTFTGGMGRFASDIVSLPVKLAKGDTLETREIPFLRKVYGKLGDRALKEEFYSNIDEVRMVYRELKHYSGDPDKLPELEKKYKKQINLIGNMRATEAYMSKYRKKLKQLERGNNKEKEENVRQIEQNMVDIMKRYNKAYNEEMQGE